MTAARLTVMTAARLRVSARGRRDAEALPLYVTQMPPFRKVLTEAHHSHPASRRPALRQMTVVARHCETPIRHWRPPWQRN